MALSLAALVLACCALAAGAQHTTASACKEQHYVGSSYSAVYGCRGVTLWSLPLALWTPLSVNVTCSTPTVRALCRAASRAAGGDTLSAS